jgi:regulatory protein
MPQITALHARKARVAVELDGRPWRTIPIVAAAEVGLVVGLELDRERARALARALRRQRAQDVALRALARRDHSCASLDARLAREHISPGARRDVLDRAKRSGLVDDSRYAEARARQLAERGAGDLLVVDDLARHGVDEPVARAALATVEPEVERAAQVVAARGLSARTVRYLASRGFTEDTLEPLVAEVESRTLR